MALIRCGVCQRFFRTLRSNQKYCSYCAGKKNYYKAQPVQHKECIECGKKFITRLSMQRFHNDACRKKYFSKKVDKEKICRFCGHPFITANSRKEYCTHVHYMKAKHIRDKIRKKRFVSSVFLMFKILL